MKNILKKLSFILVCFVTLSLVSCNDDYPDDGYFKVGEKTYYVNEAVLNNVGEDNGFYQLRLTLDNSNSNAPHSINFLFYSKVDEYLPSGLYIPYAYDEKFEHRFKRGAWLKDEGVESGVILLGTVKVTKSNETYTVHIDCKDNNNNTVTGEYKGEVKVVY